MKISARSRTIGAFCVLIMAGVSAVSDGELNPLDPGIISFYRFDEATSGNLDNSVKGSFSDSALTGTAQNHDDFDDGASDGPSWAGGSAFEPNSVRVGTGTGLIFEKDDNDRTRAEGWMNTNQGDYSEGGSFTIMARIYGTEAIDNTLYAVYANGYTSGLRLEGTSVGTLVVKASVRDGGPTEAYWNVSSGAAQPSVWWIDPNRWHNVFMIYEANTSLTVAADDGVTFQSFTDTTVPAGFDSLAEGFSDSSRHWMFGTNDLNRTDGYSVFDGRLECLVIWDRALTLEQADAIDLETPLNCPEMLEAGFKSATDLYEDCVINLADFAVLSGDWMKCNDPTDGGCTSNWPTE